jgi:hypothetical protein
VNTYTHPLFDKIPYLLFLMDLRRLPLFNYSIVLTVTLNSLEASFRIKYSLFSPVIDKVFNGFPIARIWVAPKVAQQV